MHRSWRIYVLFCINASDRAFHSGSTRRARERASEEKTNSKDPTDICMHRGMVEIGDIHCHLRFTSTHCFFSHFISFPIKAGKTYRQMPVRCFVVRFYFPSLCPLCALYDYYYEHMHEFDRCFDCFHLACVYVLCFSLFDATFPFAPFSFLFLHCLWHGVFVKCSNLWDHKQW